MADEKSLVIPIDSIERDFEDFLSPNSNKRIIFSGPFGIGKTYFLDKFFKNREPKYLPIFLRPVNYSLLSNEDVFRLIKYDILLQLISKNGFVIENEFEFSGLEYANFFIGENKFLILQNLLKLIPKIQSTIDGLENFSKLIEAFRKGKKEINEDSDLKMLFEFQQETQDNFLLEYDHVSQFIADKLDEMSEANKTEIQLKKVLIIDDLDRLDPEHIFRLFNVFSAHFDHVNYYPNREELKDNKFGFDKIIFVCDIENIRKIFAHKYGSEVDFCGYIDKFYSRKIFFFNNNVEIVKFVDEIFKPIEDNDPQMGGSYSSLLSMIKPIFIDFISANAVNHRVIEKIKLGKSNFNKPHNIVFWKHHRLRNYNLKAVQVFEYLYNLYGGNYDALLEAIQKSVKLPIRNAQYDINLDIQHLLPFLKLNSDLNTNATWNYLNNNITFQTICDSSDGVYIAKMSESSTENLQNTNYYEILAIALENINLLGIFEPITD
ncbi:MAG TPA: P-loop NTPase fold protein [Prolixibacteraceae bacterium]|nr:P-loop NTPase fold protein [Prolixibacteraceae bacterium]